VAVETAFRDSAHGAEYDRVAGPVPIWTVTRAEPNAVEFSHCHLAGEPDIDEPLLIEEVRAQLKDRLAEAGQPVSWHTRWRFFVESGPKPLSGCTLLFPVCDLQDEVQARIVLDGAALEKPERRSYRGRWYDAYPCAALASGAHDIEWASTCRFPGEFASPIVLGNFALHRGDTAYPSIVPASAQVDFGAWTNHGLASYAGPIVYRGTWTMLDITKSERIVVSVPNMNGVAVVNVNGNRAGALIYRPRECDITRFVKRGENVVEIALSPAPGQTGDAPGLFAPPVLLVERIRADAAG
jgi:hypothetical protein